MEMWRGGGRGGIKESDYRLGDAWGGGKGSGEGKRRGTHLAYLPLSLTSPHLTRQHLTSPHLTSPGPDLT